MPGGIFVRISVKTLVTSVCRACFYSVCVCQWLYFFGQLPNLEHRIQWNAFRSIFVLYLLLFFVSAIKLYFNFPFSCCVILNYHSAPLVQSSTNKADLDRVKNVTSFTSFKLIYARCVSNNMICGINGLPCMSCFFHSYL